MTGNRKSLVDSSLLNSTWMTQARVNYSHLIQPGDISEPLADLTMQVREWVEFEKHQFLNTRSKVTERIRTVFCIWFSLWDLWYYSGSVFANAEVAVGKSVD